MIVPSYVKLLPRNRSPHARTKLKKHILCDSANKSVKSKAITESMVRWNECPIPQARALKHIRLIDDKLFELLLFQKGDSNCKEMNGLWQMTGDYRPYWTLTKIFWELCDSIFCRQLYHLNSNYDNLSDEEMYIRSRNPVKNFNASGLLQNCWESEALALDCGISILLCCLSQFMRWNLSYGFWIFLNRCWVNHHMKSILNRRHFCNSRLKIQQIQEERYEKSRLKS
jgi:hypothetical protein